MTRSMSDWITQAKEIIFDCTFQDYTFVIKESRTGAVYLQATYLEADTLTGKVELQHTRRWFLSPSMSEIVATAFKCALTSMEHRTREWFLYKGRAVYQPHYDVDALWAICEEREIRTPTFGVTEFDPETGCWPNSAVNEDGTIKMPDGGVLFDAAVDRVIKRVDEKLGGCDA
jgi:hypothetical protein